MNDAARYQQAKTIFFEACERPTSDREDFIANACQGDESLRRSVLDLLDQDADPLSLNESSRWRAHLEQLAESSESSAAAGIHADSGDNSPLPQISIGGYRVLRQIGQGGMGVVYLAEQDNPRRQVALKVMAPGPISPAALRRFKQEAQVLGRLHHPGIAQIFEAGTYDAGNGSQPFFAMELVAGRPLLKYCEAVNLSRNARLELFIAICDAVDHAHHQGVIHRDLKPANILLDESASPPRPKVLDFGVARATGCDLSVTTMHTRADQIIGTVAYMSPEQLGGQGDELDRRADVYSLGVILFELLAGRLPHDLNGKTMPETIRIVGQEEPTMLATVNRSCRGDLDTVVRKSLERERIRRYDSAGELAADLRRHLADEPILARPPSTIYQLQKFARRNKTLVGGVAAVFVALVAGLATTAWQARKAIHARDEQIVLRKKADDAALLAQREAAKAVAANGFVRRMLSSVQPEVAQGRDVTVREVLDSAAMEIKAGALRSQGDVETLANLIIGDAYRGISRYVEARFHLEQSLVQARNLYGEPSPEVAAAMLALCYVYAAESRSTEAIEIAEKAVAMLRTLYPGDHDLLAEGLGNLGQYYANSGDRERGVVLKREAIEMLRRLHGENNIDVADARARLASLLHSPADAEPLLRQSLETYRQQFGTRHPRWIDIARTLAGVLVMRGNTNEASELYREAIEAGRRVHGPVHQSLFLLIQDLGFCQRMAEQTDRAVETAAQSLEMAAQLYGEESMRVAEVLIDRGDMCASLGRYDDATNDMQRAVDIAHRIHKDAEQSICVAKLGVASMRLRKRTDLDLAERLCGEVLAVAETNEPPRAWIRGWATSLLGEAALQRGQFATAEEYMLNGFTGLGSSRLYIIHRRTAASRIIQLYESWDASEPGTGKAEQAAKWKTTLEELSAPPKLTNAPR